uniref:ANF_receptor domain-containing protein n=1 Tax=Macrostomum lignano TaxID=282301 RepID=A0A1I8H1N3_9PLAT
QLNIPAMVECAFPATSFWAACSLSPTTEIYPVPPTASEAFQRLEAMIYSLMEINSDPRLLRYGRHKIVLGGRLFDTGASAKRAVRRALTFLPGRQEGANSNGSQEENTDYFCPQENGTFAPAVRIKSVFNSMSAGAVLGVVGATYSAITQKVTELLGLFNLPRQKKISAVCPAASTRPDSEQGEVLADIVAHFGQWNYVDVIYTDSIYSEMAVRSFEKSIQTRNICIAERVRLSWRPRSIELTRVINHLKSLTRFRVVLLFLDMEQIKLFLSAAGKAGLRPGKFVLISLDSWDISSLQQIDSIARGSIIIDLNVPKHPTFDQYFTSLRPRQLRTIDMKGAISEATFFNRYFDDFWQQKFNCSLDQNAAKTRAGVRLFCADSLRFDLSQFQQQWKVQYVSDAVYTFARALDHAMKLVFTPQNPDYDSKASVDFNDCVRNITEFPGDELYRILISKNNSSVNSAGATVEYNNRGDALGSYTVYNYQANSSTGLFEYAPVGSWSANSGLDISAQDIQWPSGGSEPPNSVCSEACPDGMAKVKLSGLARDKCCWSCR